MLKFQDPYFCLFSQSNPENHTFLAFRAFSGISVQSNVDFINFTPIFISLNLQALLKTMKVINFNGYGKTVIVLHAPINKTTVQWVRGYGDAFYSVRLKLARLGQVRKVYF